MTNPFIETGDELMSRATDLPATELLPSTSRKQCCPYCGAILNADQTAGQACPRCTMEDTPATRAATKSRIGPWYVLQSRNPAAPGMKWATLMMLVERGQVTPRSVVRGPTTHQLWRFAAHVKGLSREFGLCYSCGGNIEKSARQCPHCDRIQELPGNPDALLETREPMIRETVHREIKAPAAPAPMKQPLIQPPVAAPKMAPAPPPKPKAVDFTLPPRGEIGHPPTEPIEAPRTGWHPDPGILSAKELAQAFQLDFNPQTPAPKRRSFFKSLLTLLLLGAIGFTGLMLLWTDLRLEVFAWAGRTRGAIEERIADWGKKAPAAEAEVLAGAGAAPATEPANVAPPPDVKSATASVRDDVNPQPRQTIPDPAPKMPTDSTPVVEEDPVDQARTLWTKAIDAEAKQDYPEAITLYEQIKKLPPQAWPAGLEIRLAAAKKQLQ